jgi:hypothetical protein
MPSRVWEHVQQKHTPPVNALKKDEKQHKPPFIHSVSAKCNSNPIMKHIHPEMRTVPFSVFLHTSSLGQNRSLKDDDAAAECSGTAFVSKSGPWNFLLAPPRLKPPWAGTTPPFNFQSGRNTSHMMNEFIYYGNPDSLF